MVENNAGGVVVVDLSTKTPTLSSSSSSLKLTEDSEPAKSRWSASPILPQGGEKITFIDNSAWDAVGEDAYYHRGNSTGPEDGKPFVMLGLGFEATFREKGPWIPADAAAPIAEEMLEDEAPTTKWSKGVNEYVRRAPTDLPNAD